MDCHDLIEIGTALPKHKRCSAHTLNLILQGYLKKLGTYSNFTCNHKNAFDKCHNIWHKQGTSSGCDTIKEMCGKTAEFILNFDCKFSKKYPYNL